MIKYKDRHWDSLLWIAYNSSLVDNGIANFTSVAAITKVLFTDFSFYLMMKRHRTGLEYQNFLVSSPLFQTVLHLLIQLLVLEFGVRMCSDTKQVYMVTATGWIIFVFLNPHLPRNKYVWVRSADVDSSLTFDKKSFNQKMN